jgi:hypothetical protein
MNYRRGFQRLYVVLTVAWVAIACFANQWKAQPRADEGAWFTRNALPKSTFGDDSAVKLPPGAKLMEPPPGYTPDKPTTAPPDEFDQYKVKPNASQSHGTASLSDIVSAESPNSNPQPTAALRYAKGISIALVPPAFGYLMLFQVVPWVWRGFRPATRTTEGDAV